MEKKIAIVQFPGSNCEDESIFALKRVGISCEPFLWNDSVEKLKEFAGYFIVGGFSYEDRSRAGVIASLDPVMTAIADEAGKGKVVLGICNGAQVLVETGLVPGYASRHVGMVLAPNRMEKTGQLVGVGYYNNHCYLKTGLLKGSNAFNRCLGPDDLIRVPFAHAEGRFIFEDTLADQMEQQQMLAFRYVDSKGKIQEDYPVNPNGSERSVAAVVNPSGNVMAMMPHPERVPEGDVIFESVGEYMKEYDQTLFTGKTIAEPERATDQDTVTDFKLGEDKWQIPVKLIITDNTACSVEDALQKKGMKVEVERWILWTLESSKQITQSERHKILSTGELLNTNKEFVDEVANIGSDGENAISLLVDSPVQPAGAMKKQTLEKRFGVKNIDKLRQRTIWKVKAKEGELDVEGLMKSHIFHNPVTDKITKLVTV